MLTRPKMKDEIERISEPGEGKIVEIDWQKKRRIARSEREEFKLMMEVTLAVFRSK